MRVRTMSFAFDLLIERITGTDRHIDPQRERVWPRSICRLMEERSAATVRTADPPKPAVVDARVARVRALERCCCVPTAVLQWDFDSRTALTQYLTAPVPGSSRDTDTRRSAR